MIPIDHAWYINLTHRTDRKEQIEAELNKMGIEAERFPAFYDSFGALGCSMSHLAVWQLSKQRGYKRILVFEDDFMFRILPHQFRAEMVALETITFDVCMLSYNVLHSSPTCYPFVCRVHDAQTTSGYILTIEYVDTLSKVVRASLDPLQRTQNKTLYALDMVMKPLQKSDNWYLTTTRIGTQRSGFSDIEQAYVDYSTFESNNIRG